MICSARITQHAIKLLVTYLLTMPLEENTPSDEQRDKCSLLVISNVDGEGPNIDVLRRQGRGKWPLAL